MFRSISQKLANASTQQLTQWLAAIIFVSLAAYIGLTQTLELPEETTNKAFTALDYVIFIFLALASYALRALRWLWMSAKLGLCVPYIQNSLIYVAGFALAATPGHVAELAKVVFLKPFQVSASQSLSLIFNDRFMDMVTAALFTCLLITFVPSLSTTLGLFALLLVLIAFVFALLGRQKFQSKFANIFRALSTAYTPNVFSVALMFSVASWGCQSIIFYLIVNQFIEVSFPACAGVYMAALTLGALSMIPGGIGAAELSMGGLLSLFGADIATASFIALFTRLFTFWPALVLGWLSLFTLSVRAPRV